MRKRMGCELKPRNHAVPESASACKRPGIELTELVAIRLKRRDALKGLASALAFVGLGIAARPTNAEGGTELKFAGIEHGYDADLHVPDGYLARPLLRWGDPVLPNAPEFDALRPSAAAQSQQFGYNCDFVQYFPLPQGSNSSDHGLIFVNHESTISHLMFPGIGDEMDGLGMADAARVAIEMQAHGLSVVEIQRAGETWRAIANSPFNRRVTATTPVEISGPAAGHARLTTSADKTGRVVLGTINNCGGGRTPWGTVLSAEENFNGYFAGEASQTPEAGNHLRYGVKGEASFAWALFEPRFDVSKEPNEPNRFGWIVEIDPYRPDKSAVKRTALGRLKHEAATTTLSSDGRLVVYTGDDERFEYVYKYVSKGRYDPAKGAENSGLLDDGTLHVARFAANGIVEWLPLVWGVAPLIPANGFHSQADVLIETRKAADLLGATQMDRPEDIEVNPVTGKVYLVLTKNDQRGPEQIDAVNARPGNKWGQIVELSPPSSNGSRDHAAGRFSWEMFIRAGNPRDASQGAVYGEDVGANGWFNNPDNLAFDPSGRMWIATDGFADFGVHDGLWATETEGDRRSLTRHFLGCPRGAELCGPEFTPDGRTLFVSVQHPGDEKGSNFDAPSTRWPDFDDKMPPRPSVVAITKSDGGIIGA